MHFKDTNISLMTSGPDFLWYFPAVLETRPLTPHPLTRGHILTLCCLQNWELLFKKQPTLLLSLCVLFRLNECCWSQRCSTKWKWFHHQRPPLSKDGSPLRIQICWQEVQKAALWQIQVREEQKKATIYITPQKGKCKVTYTLMQLHIRLKAKRKAKHLLKKDFALSGMSWLDWDLVS